MLSDLLSIGQLLPIALIVVIVVCIFESCWRKCPPDKLMIVSGAGKMRSVSGKGTLRDSRLPARRHARPRCGAGSAHDRE